MSPRRTPIEIALFVFLLPLISCASGGGKPVSPELLQPSEQQPNGRQPEEAGNACLWGMWGVTLDAVSGKAKVVPVRGLEFTCNVTRFLQPPISPVNQPSVKIDPSSHFASGYVVADISLTHPFPGLDFYTGFDVRGVVIGDGSVQGIVDPSTLYAGPNDLRLLNADGLTRWFNPSEFTTYGKLFGFTPGNQGTPESDFTATLNGYRYFSDGLGKEDDAVQFFASASCPNPRGYFMAGSTLTRRYLLQFPVVGGKPQFRFQYGIVASWEPPLEDPPDVPGDFSVAANCAEAYMLSTDDLSDMYFVDENDKGGTLRLRVRVFDHQGGQNPAGVAGEVSAVHLEMPDGPIAPMWRTYEGAALLSCIEDSNSTSVTFLFEESIAGLKLTAPGDFPVLIAVESSSPGNYDSGFAGFAFPENARLSAYFTSSVHVNASLEFGWARTWGGGDYDTGYLPCVDSQLNVYVAGEFTGGVDFDPGGGIDIHQDGGAFLSKFDSNGNFKWARTWGASGTARADAIGVDSSDNIYITGQFDGEMDFDPGPDTDIHASNGGQDIFLSKFDSNGNLMWARTWGGPQVDAGFKIAVDPSGHAYVTGGFQDCVDFDPGPGTDDQCANDDDDVFLSKFDSAGNHLWTRTWGSQYEDLGDGAAVDSSGCVLVTGIFYDSVDFDPSAGSDIHNSNGLADVFLNKLDADGNFVWARTWGGLGWDLGDGVAIDSSGNAYVTGPFRDKADFDPGPGTDIQYSKGFDDVYLSKIDSDGNHQWTRTWGGTENMEWGEYVAVDTTGNVFVTGGFGNTVDFDPGPGTDIRTSQGDQDAYLSTFDANGSFRWAVTWGEPEPEDYGFGVALDPLGNVYVTGEFRGTIDFDPGPTVDNHHANGERDAFLMKLLPDGSW